MGSQACLWFFSASDKCRKKRSVKPFLRIYKLKRTNLNTKTPWEPLIGFSRAVKIGDQIFLSGTTAIDASGEVFGVNDPYRQAKKVIENVKKSLEAFGASLSDVVQTRMYVTDISMRDHFARAHREAFGEIRPVHTMMEVKRLVDARMLVDMEVHAIIGTSEVSDQTLESY